MVVKALKSIAILIAGIVALCISFVYKLQLGNVAFWLLFALGLLCLLGGLGGVFTLYKDHKNGDISDKNMPSYKRKKALVTSAEWDFYQVLKHLMPADRYEVLPQTALLSVIDKVTHTSYRNELFRIIDFCIMDAKTSAPLLLIELNDASHKRADRIERDKKVNAICQSAKMPLVTFTMQEATDINFVKKQINKNILK